MREWIPLLQTLVWPIFVIGLALIFRSSFSAILHEIKERIKSGSPLEAGPRGFKLGGITKELEKLPDAPQKPTEPAKLRGISTEPTDWRQERVKEYKRVDRYALVHVYRPSTLPNQKYDIFLFVVRHQKGTDGPPQRQFNEIAKAEFYFGESWGNEIFPVENTGSMIGVRTHAWGTFLACCRLTFKDTTREPIILFRYVDFHMLQDIPNSM
ncbi:hypothetical protein WJ32_23350 [Burkholderia ubonensis]|uniref:Prokaryotic YEATS domain-containing protein n=1 Tax=Burkholderia ubonensis TaxID=101571 RepID=A0A124R675_9BURK|nr:pYEATS domain-containing protein [Burkholderia ubonensis]AOJ65422.1 hypothetical protein WJ32_23350 [Burkholderia ubonensis]KVG51091.1 hypothetical protein WJ33_11730 [Burkholderia ubonensis]